MSTWSCPLDSPTSGIPGPGQQCTQGPSPTGPGPGTASLISRQSSSDHSPSTPVAILPEEHVVGVCGWQVEMVVNEAHWQHPDPGTYPRNRLFVPDPVHSQVLQLGHASQFACHSGINRTIIVLLHFFWWPTMEKWTNPDARCCVPSYTT